MKFALHTTDTAPEASIAALAEIERKYGFLPNLAGVFAESPAVLRGLTDMLRAYEQPEMSLTPLERQVVLLAVSVKNRCEYCAAAHSMMAHGYGLAEAEVGALQTGRRLEDGKLEALRRFAEEMVDARGQLPEGRLEEFLGAGFSRAEVLEVILGIALKTLTNYVNHVAKPPVNAQFARYLPGWAKAA